MAIPNRLAVSGEHLVVHRFEAGTVGLASASVLRRQECRKAQNHGFWSRLTDCFDPQDIQPIPAVCIPPGARLLVQDISPKLQHECGLQEMEAAVFTQVTAVVNTFQDAVRFHNGVEIRLQRLDEGQRVCVLDLSSADEPTTAITGQQTMMV
jgi:hypothetical protein